MESVTDPVSSDCTLRSEVVWNCWASGRVTRSRFWFHGSRKVSSAPSRYSRTTTSTSSTTIPEGNPSDCSELATGNWLRITRRTRTSGQSWTVVPSSYLELLMEQWSYWPSLTQGTIPRSHSCPFQVGRYLCREVFPNYLLRAVRVD